MQSGRLKVNYDKLPSGIDGLAEKINKIGMKFGLWFEPEMISPDSICTENIPIGQFILTKEKEFSQEIKWCLI